MNRRYWIILLVYIVMQLSAFVGVPLLYFLGLSETQSFAGWTIGSFIVALFVMIWILRPEKEGVREHPKLQRTSTAHAVKWSVLGIFLAVIAQYIAVLIEQEVFKIEPGSQNTQMIMDIIEKVPLMAIVVALVGPILEEIVFRKVIFGAFFKRFNFIISALLSSVVFAIVHFDFTHLLIYTAIGFTFSYLYVKTGRILVPIAAHVAVNGYAILMNNLLGDKIEEMQKELEQAQFILGGLFL